MLRHIVQAGCLAAVLMALIPAESPAASIGVPCIGAKIRDHALISVYARPDGRVLGSLAQGEAFVVVRVSRHRLWTFGYAWGPVKSYGWVFTRQLEARGCAKPQFTG